MHYITYKSNLKPQNFLIHKICIIIIIIGSTAVGGPWPPQANVASNLYPGHTPANFYNPVSLRHPTLALILDVMSFSVVDGHHKASRKGWNVIKERRGNLGAEYDIRLLAVVTNGHCPNKTSSTSTCSTRRHEFKLDPIAPMLTPTGSSDH